MTFHFRVKISNDPNEKKSTTRVSGQPRGAERVDYLTPHTYPDMSLDSYSDIFPSVHSQPGGDAGPDAVTAGLPPTGGDPVREASSDSGPDAQHAGHNGAAAARGAAPTADEAERVRFHVQEVQGELAEHRQPRRTQRLAGQERRDRQERQSSSAAGSAAAKAQTSPEAAY